MAECQCVYNYDQNLLPAQTVSSPEACRSLIGSDLSHRYLDHEICDGGGSLILGWSCGERISPARMHRCEDIGMGIIKEQLGEIFSVSLVGPEVECDEEEFRLRPLVAPESRDDSSEQFRIKPWKRGVKVRYRLEF